MLQKNGDLLVSQKSPLQQCSFCHIQETKTTKPFQILHGDLPHTLNVPGVPASWVVLQDAVPIGELGGHLLILPNKHHISLATVADQEELRAAARGTVASIRQFFSNPIFFFEHGPGFIGEEPIACGGCHMDHAHEHFTLLPQETEFITIQDKLEQTLAASGWNNSNKKAVKSSVLFEKLDSITGVNPYLHIGMVGKNGSIVSVTYVQHKRSEQVESQLLRRIISEVVYHQPEAFHWHWRDIAEGFAPPAKVRQLQQNVVRFRQITGF